MNGKPLRFSIHGRLSEFFRIMAAKTLKNPYHLQTATFKIFKKGQKTNIGEEKTESYTRNGLSL